MNKNGLISVIVTTYNRPDALHRVLQGLFAQTDLNFEIIVADDGSGEATRKVIAEFQSKQLGLGLKRLNHAWQIDDGFRAAAVRNLGVAQAQGSYLIFLDGDCVPRPQFVARHRLLAEVGYFVLGSRVLLFENFTQQVLRHRDLPIYNRSFIYYLGQRLQGNINKLFPLIYLNDGHWRHKRTIKWRRIKSCNLAIWRNDYEAVDGFDESFTGWGHEDADLVLRLARYGVKGKSGAFSTEVFHLWHKENTRTNESINRQRVDQRIKNGVVRAEIGLASHKKNV